MSKGKHDVHPSVSILSDITVYNKYAKYIPELERRETWSEIVTRNKDMHISKFPNLKDEIEKAYELVYKMYDEMFYYKDGYSSSDVDNINKTFPIRKSFYVDIDVYNTINYLNKKGSSQKRRFLFKHIVDTNSKRLVNFLKNI
jgi:hypothetical protein